jgi:hypothetical protein
MNTETMQDERPAGKVVMLSELRAKRINLDGSVDDFGVVGRRMVTKAAVKFLTDRLANTTPADVANIKQHASGTGVAAESVLDVGLYTDPTDNGSGSTEVGSRVAGSQVSAQVGNNATYTSVATVSYTGAATITEHMIAWLAAGDACFDRTLLAAAIGVVNGSQIQFTYTLTINSGN